MNTKKTIDDDPLESKIQADIIERATLRGWWIIKIVSPSRRGVCDLYALRNGRHIWIEVKRPGETPTRQQEKVHREMRDRGAEVFVVDNLDDASWILK